MAGVRGSVVGGWGVRSLLCVGLGGIRSIGRVVHPFCWG